MRYTLDTIGEQAQSWGNTLRRAEERNEIKIIEKGDPIELVRGELLKMKNALSRLESLGIGNDLMIAYMRYRGVKQSSIDNVLYHQKEFLRKIKVLK